MLDLDKLLPEVKIVRINNQDLKLNPGKVSDILDFQRAKQMMATDDVKGIEMLVEIIYRLMPEAKELKIDFTVEMLSEIISYAFDGKASTKEQLVEGKIVNGEKKIVV